MVSATFDAKRWKPVEGFDFEDITYHRSVEHGTVRIAFHRPEVRNAFRPRTVDELYRALERRGIVVSIVTFDEARGMVDRTLGVEAVRAAFGPAAVPRWIARTDPTIVRAAEALRRARSARDVLSVD